MMEIMIDDDDDDAAMYEDTVSAERLLHWKAESAPVQLLDFSSSSLVVAQTSAALSRPRCRPSKTPKSPPTVYTHFISINSRRNAAFSYTSAT